MIMQKPNSYDETRAEGFTPVITGGHHLVIKQVVESKSKSGKNMLVVLFDMAANDSQPGYMAEEFKNDMRPEKKWPHSGTQYILTEDSDGKCSKSFKRFVTAFEKSNNCSAVWGEKFCAQFKNKKIGGVFGEVENDYNGKTFWRSELRWFCEDADADKAAVPERKSLSNGNSGTTSSAPATANTPAGDPNAFMSVEESGEEIPWG